MSIPISLQEDRFLSLPKNEYSKILYDDYFHNNNLIETIKLKAVSPSGAIVNYKNLMQQNSSTNKTIIQQSDELKILFPFKKQFIQAKIDRIGNQKEHIELGEYKNLVFYTQFKHNLSYEHIWARFGFFNLQKQNQLGLRIERDRYSNLFIGLRNTHQYKNAKISTIFLFDLKKAQFFKFDNQLIYNHNDTQVSLTHLADGLQLGNLKFGISNKISNENAIGASIIKDFAQQSDAQLEFGIQNKYSQKLITKFKINDSFNSNFGFKYAVDSNISIGLSFQIDISKGKNVFDFSKLLFTPMGYQLDLNY